MSRAWGFAADLRYLKAQWDRWRSRAWRRLLGHAHPLRDKPLPGLGMLHICARCGRGVRFTSYPS